MKQYQITSRPRHLRYMFFVDENFSYDKLFKLMCLNQTFWGGRYNPIVPVKDNVISDRYIKLIENYDPDYIYYSEEVDPETIKKLILFNPAAYYNLEEALGKGDILGVHVLYLLSLFNLDLKVATTEGLASLKSPLFNFYQLNLGLDSSTLQYENEIMHKYSIMHIDTNNFENINEILHCEQPLLKPGLAKFNIHANTVRNQREAGYGQFEIVIAKDKSSISDLIYFWNRMLYEMRNIFIITVEELDLLAKDKYFGNLLYDLSNNVPIKVVSMSLDKDVVECIINEKLNPIAINRTFQYKGINNFPFDVIYSDTNLERDFYETFSTQVLISKKGLFYLPKLSFTKDVSYISQKWAVDIELIQVGDSHFRNKIKLPYTTATHSIIKGVDGRINRENNISIIIHNRQNTSDFVEINIPSFQTLLPQLITCPMLHGESSYTKYIGIKPHDSSNSLNAFIKVFNSNFRTIEKLFRDIFWVDLFEDLSTNERIAGDAISFDEINQKAVETLRKSGVELGLKEDTHKTAENLEFGLKDMLKELCDYSVFFKGFSIKCSNCSSKFWYSINDVTDKIICKGCLEKFDLPIEPKFSYKLNDLIKNNIFQTRENRNGNLTVIRTLAYIYQHSLQSFAYSPQLNVFDDFDLNKPSNELDVVCMSDGLFIIGEAKHNSKGFFEKNMKSLKSLVEISKIIYPDKIILSCYEGELEKLVNARKSLIRLFKDWEYSPVIDILLLDAPNDSNIKLGTRYFLSQPR